MLNIKIDNETIEALQKNDETPLKTFKVQNKNTETVQENNFIINNTNFKNRDFSKFDFSNLEFISCSFEKCKFYKTNLKSTYFNGCYFNETDFTQAIFGKVYKKNYTYFIGHRRKSEISNSKFDNSKGIVLFNRHTLENCSFIGADYKNSTFQNVSFKSSNLIETDFKWCSFSGHVTWENTLLNNQTNFEYADFNEQTYPIDNDKSDKVKISKLDLPTWNHVNFLSSIPIFQTSFAIFIFALFLANIIETLNNTGYIETIKYPIPMPRQLIWVLISSGLLFTGSFLYRIGCPHEVQDFTASQWVYEHKKARLLYIQKTLQNWKTKVACVACLTSGGLIAGWIIINRIIDIL